MTQIYLCSDLHLGHQKIAHFRPWFKDQFEHEQAVADDWKKHVKKHDLVYCVGDIAFTKQSLALLSNLPGRKILVRGNHDVLPTPYYAEVFEEIYGLVKYKEFWVSHPPIHPEELRGRYNLHGHVHGATVQMNGQDDKRYVNLCNENLRLYGFNFLISLDEVRALIEKHHS
jgi:calcineurin-like phosphoesterase family protein